MIRHLGPRADVEGVVDDARREGREVHVVRAGPTKESTLAAFAAQLRFPTWFGGNLDALDECLGHVARTAEGEWELVVDGVAELGRADPRALAGLLAVLGEVARANPRFHVTVVER